MESIKIEEIYSDATLNIAFDTLKINKQALIFVNTKRSAESLAEKIAQKVKNISHEELKNSVKDVLSRPTKQCERLSRCVDKGIAFHHAGLAAKQREIVEDNFRNGTIKIICSTPTLCLSKDTKVWHGTLETKVSELDNNPLLFVLSKKKLISVKPQKVQKIMNFSKLIHISSVSGYSIKVTPNHKMFIKRKNKCLVLEAIKVKKTDKIATIGYLNIAKEHTPKLAEFIKDNDCEFKQRRFDNNLSYLIGAMIGDGYSGAESNDKSILYKGSPMIVGADEEILNKIIFICKDIHISTRKAKSSGNVPQLVLGKNKWFREFLVRCGVEKGEQKYISSKLMNMPLDNIKHLISGLFDTDGWVEKKSCVGFCNISEKLIRNIQKLLLRFGITTYIRKKKAGSMRIYDKEYKTKECFELLILQKKGILDFYRYIGFNLKRKQEDLLSLVSKLASNLNYVECKKCDYKIYRGLFYGRTDKQKKWGLQKLEIIKLLGKNGESKSRELNKLLNFEPKKNETRLNHHYELIKKRRYGKNEWIWSLNKIGEWYYNNLIISSNHPIEFFSYQNCPLCNEELERVIKKGARDSDFEGDIFWDKIREAKEIPCENEVYDVVLPKTPVNDHFFVAEGFIVHNSMGLDMPAFRTVIRDLKRYGGRWGMEWIAVLEYHQMAGRAGRPGKEDFGEAICIAGTESEKEHIIQNFINGEPEEIYSKLAVEPVLRTYVLSLIVSGFVKNRKELKEFFSKTFWAQQYKDLEKLGVILNKMIRLLEEWGFLKSATNDFKSASLDETLEATRIGERVAQLYIDPYTANFMITCLKRAKQKEASEFSYMQMISSTLEMRPIFRVAVKEAVMVEDRIAEEENRLIMLPPSLYEPEYDEFMSSIKTAIVFEEWINEMDEHDILEKYNVRPGEFRAKLDEADWLLNASSEFAGMLDLMGLIKVIRKTQVRLKYGAKEELIALLKLRNIGRVRARTLYKNGIKDLGDVSRADLMKLTQLLGPAIAKDIKKQIGEEIEEVKTGKRKGQKSVDDY